MESRGERSNRYLFFGACLSALFLICMIWITFDLLFLPLQAQGETVEIGNYCGVRLVDAEVADWMTVTVEYRNSADVPAGEIMLQRPSAGSRRKLSRIHPKVEVTFTVSLGVAHATLPNVVGKNAREAEQTLRQLGFVVVLEKQESVYETGTVFEMYPSASTELPCGERVRLKVSEGMPEVIVKVPNVCGLTRGDALTELWLSELSVKEVIEEWAPEDADGVVLRQDYRAGTLVRAGTAITIVVGNSQKE